MAHSNIPAGFCDICGEQIFIGNKFCHHCGNKIDANTRLIPSSLAPTQAVLPPTQYVFPPTQPVSPPTVLSMTPPITTVAAPNLPSLSLEEQIDIARTSLTNPYTDWGRLICNDSDKKMWREGRNNYITWAYAGNAFCITGSDGYVGTQSTWISQCSGALTDFTFQVHVKIQPYDKSLWMAGLAFRCNSSNTICYEFCIQENNTKKEVFLMAHLGGTSLELARKELTSKSVIKDEYLLAVVAQGPMIDLYIDCTHIAQFRDYHLSSGAVGLTAHFVKAAIFTHAKVWTKDEPKKLRIK